MARLSLVALLTIMVALAPSAPAEAAQVFLKDGRQLSGHLKVDGSGVSVTDAEGKTETLPYGAIQGISLDDQPLDRPPHDVPHSRYFDNDWLVWSAVGANVATMVLALVAIYRATHETAATP